MPVLRFGKSSQSNNNKVHIVSAEPLFSIQTDVRLTLKLEKERKQNKKIKEKRTKYILRKYKEKKVGSSTAVNQPSAFPLMFGRKCFRT